MPEAYPLVRGMDRDFPINDPPPPYPVEARFVPSVSLTRREVAVGRPHHVIEAAAGAMFGLFGGAAVGSPVAFAGGVLVAGAWHGSDIWEGGRLEGSQLRLSKQAGSVHNNAMVTMLSTSMLLGGVLGAHVPFLRPRETRRLQVAVGHLTVGVYAGLCGGVAGLGGGALVSALATAFMEPLTEEGALAARIGSTTVGVLMGWAAAGWYLHAGDGSHSRETSLFSWSPRPTRSADRQSSRHSYGA